MDSFEQVVATVLDRAGYWVRTSVKVALTPEEKREIGRPSSPRWELDVVAYSGSRNELLVVECKSYLDSYGVRLTSFDGSKAEEETRYKLFSDEVLRRVVLGRLEIQLAEQGFCPSGTKATLCLAAGKIYGDPVPLRAIFQERGWRLLETDWLVKGLQQLAEESYDNSVASVVAKLLLRNDRRPGEQPARVAPERERLETDVRRAVLIAALYLSRFGHEALQLGNQDQTLDRLAAQLGVKKNTLKNYRDYFDPHTESGRRGWWQVDLPSDLGQILNEFRMASEPELRAHVIGAMRKNSPAYSTSIGFTNNNRQTVLQATDLPGTDHGQSIYVLRCGDCGSEYGANGSDIWLRKCPNCQGGRAGLALS
ncbi:MAG TPA: hypothetical protein VKB93_09420 [Thermoanaerobaculia bacterium]|nr:hypothetical protein [Thermoanaerobaculia bacterium]